MTAPVETVALFGVRCGTPEEHYSDGRIYASSQHLYEMASLARNTCYDLVVSHDGGHTWEPYTRVTP